jgi:hypothetical protein
MTMHPTINLHDDIAWGLNGRVTDVPITEGANPLEAPSAEESSGMPPLIPNRGDIAKHLYAVFAPAFVQPHPDSWIEIAYGNPAVEEGKPNEARNFSPFELQQAVAFAEQQNTAGLNVYVGAALRHGTRPHSGRASGDHVLAASHAWCEYEGVGDDERIAPILKDKGLVPAMVLTTGTVPHIRRHLYFKIDGSATPDEARAANAALKKLLGTDSVQNPDRIMRLAGTVNYPPNKKQGRGYVTELVTLHQPHDARAYSLDELIGVTPGGQSAGYNESEERPAPTVESFFKDVNALALTRLSHWVKPLFGNFVKFYPGTGCWRTTSESNKVLRGRAQLEEALSISQRGVWDYGFEEPSDPISLVIDYGPQASPLVPASAKDAAFWLCERMGIAPEALGWNTRERRSADDAGFESGYGSDGGASAGSEFKDTSFKWGAPQPLPTGLKPVAAFDYEFLPQSIAPWVRDISDRMQCPPDFVAVSAITALGATLGCRIGIRPQKHTSWIEVPNAWGCIIGRPGAMKSPAMNEALKPLQRLEAEARKRNESAAADFAAEKEAHELRKQQAQKKAKAALDKGEDITKMLRLDPPEEPKPRRYVVNDCTYEALGEILSANPNGVFASRDELVSLLKTLDREEQAAARGFFLTAWNGTSGYTFDRIIRGRTYVERACLSLLGSTQPGKIAEYMRQAITGGASDDGLIQRFGLLVWPDQSPEWKEVDRYPDSAARETAWQTFERLNDLTPGSVKAETDQYETIPYLRFDKAGQGLFSEWREDLEKRLRSGSLHPAMESHLSKYRKLIPGLALINHLADSGVGPISDVATLRAVSLAEYLETHARRAYAAGSEAEASAAKAILGHIRKGDLVDGFTARDIHQRDWSNLTDRGQVQAGLSLLVECDWIAPESVRTTGRAKTVYRINPEATR